VRARPVALDPEARVRAQRIQPPLPVIVLRDACDPTPRRIVDGESQEVDVAPIHDRQTYEGIARPIFAVLRVSSRCRHGDERHQRAHPDQDAPAMFDRACQRTQRGSPSADLHIAWTGKTTASPMARTVTKDPAFRLPTRVAHEMRCPPQRDDAKLSGGSGHPMCVPLGLGCVAGRDSRAQRVQSWRLSSANRTSMRRSVSKSTTSR
jgi:hypothetical protein